MTGGKADRGRPEVHERSRKGPRRVHGTPVTASATAPNAWRRYLYVMLDAYRAERAHPIPEPPMTYEQLYDAMVHLSEAS
jgi:hypothetical protein